MEKAFEDKKCKDCVHYLPHYTRCRGQYRPTGSGHCMNRKPSGHSRHTDKICECFEQRDLTAEKEEQIKSALEWLSFIAERLNELVHIFTEIEEEKIAVKK